MPYLDEPISLSVTDAINSVLRSEMGRYGFSHADVYPGQDHDGEQVLIIEAVYRPYSGGIPRHATFGLVRKVRDRLGGLGERRFPHIRHKFDDGQVVIG